VKVPCDPYEYTIEESGEVITLDFKYEYAPDKTDDRSAKTETRDVEVKPDLKTFSTNGSRELVEA
jgi:elongation factor P hydroxylase